MALTQIPIELSSTPGIVDNSNATAITIDSSENVLVGKTSSNLNTAGVEIDGNNNRIYVTRDASRPMSLNRLTSDGDILGFFKDGTSVGSVGALSGHLYIGNSDTGLRFVDSLDCVEPFNTDTPTLRDAGIDLGRSAARFKDLYLSGGAYLGGTAAANKLDDYEEGTWTPTSNTGTITANYAKYVKVGRLVFVTFNISNFSDITSSASVQINGLPFTSSSDQISTGATFHRYINKSGYYGSAAAYSPNNASYIRFYFTGGSNWGQMAHSDITSASANIYGAISYYANS